MMAAQADGRNHRTMERPTCCTQKLYPPTDRNVGSIINFSLL